MPPHRCRRGPRRRTPRPGTAPFTVAVVRLAALALALAAAPPSARADTLEPNDSIAQAYGPVASGVPVSSFIGHALDRDFYSFDAAPGAATITLTGIPPGTDYDLFLEDEFGIELLTSQNESNEDELIEFAIFATRRLYIEVSPHDGFSDADPYLLTVVYQPVVTNTAPEVRVLAPDGGEALDAGSPFEIAWTASDAEDGAALAVDIELSADGGATFSAVAAGLDNTGAHPWTVPSVATTAGRIRVAVRDSGGLSAADTSDADFSILVPPPLGNAVVGVGSATVDAGAVVAIPVTVTHDQPMAGTTLTVRYDPIRLLAQSVTAGAHAGALSLAADLTHAGEVRLALTSTEGAVVPAGAGPVATIAFLADPGARGDVPLVPEGAAVTDSLGRNMLVLTADGAVTIQPIPPELTLTAPGDAVGEPGGSVDVAIAFANNVPVGSLRFTLRFDSAALVPDSVTQGSGTAGMLLEAELSTAGEARITFSHPSGGALGPGSGTACTLHFAIPSPAPGATVLTFDDVFAADRQGGELPVTAVSGQVTGVRTVSLDAAAAGDGVRVTWTAAGDGEHLGFRVRRGEDAEEALHDGLLPPDAREFVDRSAVPGRRYAYWLEALDRRGFVQRFGPARVETAPVPAWVGVPHPNPGRAAVSVAVRGLAEGDGIVVLDAAGRRVRRLVAPPDGTGLVTWDGRTDEGGPAPAGVYFLRAGRGVRAVTRSLVRLGP